VVVEPINSYTFVNTVFKNLASFGLELESYLNVYSTAFTYAANSTDSDSANAEVISWTSGDIAPVNVYAWYEALSTCYAEAFNTTALEQTGATTFLELITSCYSSDRHALVYASANSVYNVCGTLVSIVDSCRLC
jgi:hypothetical protein